ncbi:hypothetical protein Q3G72_018645 [Acer saccharum]|nr:hypothetical protein Q3G72_018645 [Acer saccharum]
MRLDSKLGDLVIADEIARAVKCVMDGDSEVRKKVKEMAENGRKSLMDELGLAVELRLDSRSDNGDLVTADEIARAVRCVMDDDSEVRKKVKNMAEISRKCLMDGGSSFVSVGQFIDLNF